MLNVKGFFDYCISEKCLENNKYETTIRTLYEYGYRTIAINQTLDGTDLEPKKKKKKGQERESTNIVPDPHKITILKGCEDLKILNRLTITFSNQDVLHNIIKSTNYKKFDIIAVLPTTASAIMFVCSNFDGDIFCFNPENKNNFKRTRKMYEQLIEKGYHFEIPYGPAIEDRTQRKNIMHTAHIYHALFKARKVIISSCAGSPLLLRNPYDIINLALIFGLNEQQAKNSIGHCGRQVFINSIGRRHGKAVIFVENMKDNVTNVPKDEDPIMVNDSMCVLGSSEDEMEVNQPAVKKVKQ